MQNSWIITFKPNRQARVRLLCFPYAGSGIAIFRAWVESLPAQVELCAVQLPGRENRLREPLFTRLDLAVQTCAEQLRPYLDMPFAFFGHSMGSLMAFEATRQLRGLNYPMPIHLFVSGRRAPHVPDSLPPLSDLAEPDFLDALRLRYQGLPDILLQEPELMQVFLPIIKADMQMVDTYVYVNQPPLEIPLSCYGGLQDQTLTHAGLQAWELHTRRAFRCERFAGGHFYFQQNRRLLPQMIGTELAGSIFA